ncbi:adenylate/guanylate cyclase domain-containing protein [Reyranella sp.]|uniref:adenylate/guanylate cyclase domain-containing protein n=1 Tax=Reyranella sp. TaxID=1929291 RepID=UPI003BACE96D
MAEALPEGYAKQLAREIVRNEVERVRVLAVVLVALLAATMGAVNLVPGFVERMFQGSLEWWTPLALIGPFALYELVVLYVLSRRAAAGREFPRPARFANALIETSLPSVIIFELSRHMAPETVFGFWPPLLYFVFILLSTLRLDFWLSAWTGLVAAVEQGLLVIWLLPLDLFSDEPQYSLMYNLSRSLVLLVGGIVAGIVALSLRRQFDKAVLAGAARDRVTNLFGQHVSPAVVERLLATQAEPPSEMREVCVLFLDIRGFTAMSRQRPAADTVALLNDFFARMIDIVDHHNGIINKFLGDGFLALFGAPLADTRAASNALAAGRDMLAAVERWNAERPQWALRIGIGIHLGEAVTGTVGSPQRKEYTVIGDTVNLAARLEQLTKETGSQLLVSSSVHSRVPIEAGAATDLGPMAIRGYDEGIRVWRVA